MCTYIHEILDNNDFIEFMYFDKRIFQVNEKSGLFAILTLKLNHIFPALCKALSCALRLVSLVLHYKCAMLFFPFFFENQPKLSAAVKSR